VEILLRRERLECTSNKAAEAGTGSKAAVEEIMPSAAQLVADPFLSLLVISPSGGGKTRLAATAPKPIMIFCSDDASKLDSASDIDKTFWYENVNHSEGKKLLDEFEFAIAKARRGIEKGEYKTVIWDTVTTFAATLLNAELDATDKGNGADGRQAYQTYGRRMINCVNRFLSLKCHRVVMAHYYAQPKEIDGQLKKEGEGILPGIAGSIRSQIPGMFHDVAYLKKALESEERELCLSMKGVTGPRFVGLPGVEKVEPDLTKLLARVTAKKASVGKAPAAVVSKPAVKPSVVAKPAVATGVRR
jgi:AAA domain-containing protein